MDVKSIKDAMKISRAIVKNGLEKVQVRDGTPEKEQFCEPTPSLLNLLYVAVRLKII